MLAPSYISLGKTPEEQEPLPSILNLRKWHSWKPGSWEEDRREQGRRQGCRVGHCRLMRKDWFWERERTGDGQGHLFYDKLLLHPLLSEEQFQVRCLMLGLPWEIRLPMQGTRVLSLVGEPQIPYAVGQLRQ